MNCTCIAAGLEDLRVDQLSNTLQKLQCSFLLWDDTKKKLPVPLATLKTHVTLSDLFESAGKL